MSSVAFGSTSSLLSPRGELFSLIGFGTNDAELAVDDTEFEGTTSLDASVQPLELGVGLGLRLGLGGLLQSTALFSESEVGQSYQAHLNSAPDFLWFDCEYDPQGCLRQLVMAAEDCVAYTATVEGSMSL